MDIQEMKKGPHLSASSINDYIECGLQYRFGRIDKLPPEFTPDNLEYGSAIHKALADFSQERMVGARMPLEELHRLFEHYWNQASRGRRDIRYSSGKGKDVLLKEGKELLSVYCEKIPDDGYTVIAIEEPFGFLIDGIPIVGYIDLMEEDASGTLIITDWKTSGKAYSMQDVNNNFQVTLYQMAVKAMGHKKDIVLRFDCLIKTKQPKFEQYYTVRTEKDELRAAKKIRHVWQGIQSGTFIPNDTSWKCGGCVYRKQCTEYLEEAI